MTAKSYLKVLIGIFSFQVFFVLAVNVITDPGGMFGIVDIKGFNHEKSRRPLDGGRVSSSFALRYGGYDGIILGTSRSQVGLNPTAEFFHDVRVVNASLLRTNMYEIEKVYKHAEKHLELKMVIFTLDFLMFSSKRSVQADYHDSLLSGSHLPIVLFKHLASFNTLKYSLKTIMDNARGRRSPYFENGYLDKAMDAGKVNHRKLFRSVLIDQYFKSPETYRGYSYSQERLEMFQNVLEKAAKDKINVYMVISPVHVFQLEAIRATGLHPLFERWKRDVTKIVSEVRLAYPDNKWKIELWDFSGYNSITTEDVPLLDQGEKSMKWYWESSHYKKETGDLMMKKIFGSPESVAEVPQDFGVILTQDNLEQHLSAIRDDRNKYAETHPGDIKEVNSWAKIAGENVKKFQ